MLRADPHGLGAGRPVVLAPQVTAKARHQGDDLAEERRYNRGLAALDHGVSRLPLLGVEDDLATRVRATPPEHQRGKADW